MSPASLPDEIVRAAWISCRSRRSSGHRRTTSRYALTRARGARRRTVRPQKNASPAAMAGSRRTSIPVGVFLTIMNQRFLTG